MYLVYGHTTEIVSVVYEYIISVAACSNRSNGCVVGLVLIASSRHRRQIDKISQSQSIDVVLAALSLIGTVNLKTVPIMVPCTNFGINK